ncbi:hypothetical protein [Flavobacterium hydrophilum]|uniref:Uncharacterized protein n=1 Tax=Flavobacterium hydrophilum TaxID=2211445 RepID=A0A2V4C354_9FLAO|nr:hypothetical protein [Flavobacterium hydrophilum]PXY45242.1 hypothetical protein DMB68_11160 [Flavobacterium hydrophilum]
MRQEKIITKEQLKHIIKKFNINVQINHCIILENGMIDVDGSVKITNTSLKKLPLRFRKVNGDFYCHANKLEMLKGVPDSVTGDFNCSNNQLTSLNGAPGFVGRDFACHENLLTSLKGCPQHIKGNFNAFLNQITTLNGSPQIIEGNCSLFKNRLISLESGPKYVGGSLHVTGNLLRNLVGIPSYIGNTVSIDSGISVDMGNKSCNVQRVTIEIQNKRNKTDLSSPHLLIEKHRNLLHIVFRYMNYLDIFTNGNFNQANFEDIIYDIKSGLR